MADDKIRISWDEVQSTHADDELRRRSTVASTPSPPQPWSSTPIPSSWSSIPPGATLSGAKQFLPWIIGGGLLLTLLIVAPVVGIHFFENFSHLNEPTQQQPSAAARIEFVLQQDVKAPVGAQSAAEVVTRMRAIDLVGCPNDFKAAYVAHIHAWERMADVEREVAAHKADSESGADLVESFIRGFLGDPFGKAIEDAAAGNQLQRSYQAAGQQIRDTFHRVEEVAVVHGANLPQRNK